MNKKLLTLVLALIMVVAIGLTACQEQVTLTLYDSDGKTVLKTVNVKKGEAPVKPADPQKDGFTFDGWFITPTNNTPYDFTKALDEDATDTKLADLKFIVRDTEYETAGAWTFYGTAGTSQKWWTRIE